MRQSVLNSIAPVSGPAVKFDSRQLVGEKPPSTTPISLPAVRHRTRNIVVMMTCGCGLMLSGFGMTRRGGLIDYVRRFTDATSGW